MTNQIAQLKNNNMYDANNKSSHTENQEDNTNNTSLNMYYA
jgi:hypothetical protein